MSRNFQSRFTVIALALFATLALAFGPAAGAQAKRPITVEDLWAVKRLGAPSLSRDARWAAVQVTTYSMEQNNSSADIWLLPTEGGAPRQLTAHAASDTSPAWSPDGRSIAFLSRRESDDATQLYLISPDGGEARRVTRLSTGVSGIRWFPDSKRVAFISWVWPQLKSDAEQSARAKERATAKVKAHVIDDTKFRHWDQWLADGRVPHLFVAHIDTGETFDLFSGTPLSLPREDPSAAMYDIAPDGAEIAFTGDLSKDPGYMSNPDVLTIAVRAANSAAAPAWKNITADNPAADGNPRYSPDGKFIAYLRNAIPRFEADRSRIALQDRSSGSNRVLTEAWDRSADPPIWSPDSRSLYFTAEDRARVPVWVLSVIPSEARNPSSSSPRAILEGASHSSLALSSDGRRLAYLRTTMGQPPAVFTAASDGSGPRKIESFNDALAAQWKLGEVKDMTFAGSGGAPVQMWVIYPPDFDPTKKWPLIQAVHGGPHGAWLDQFHFRWNMHLLASRGHVVAAVNFHGSTGWGQNFTHAIIGNFGKMELDDVERSTDHLIAAGYIDPQRLSAAGGSFGGYMVAWMNGHTDRYKAYVCHAGVFDYVHQMASDWVRGRDYAWGGFPWETPRVNEVSARAFSRNFKTPTLVIHGEQDFRVPVTQGFAYYTTLRMMQVPARLLYFPDENHWVMKPQNSRLWHQEVFAWIEKYTARGPS